MSDTTRRRGPVPIGDLIDAFLTRVGGGRAPDFARLIADWDHHAGPPWAGRSRPVRLDADELLVEVADGSAASLLRFQIPALIEHLGTSLGHGVVTSVRLRVASPGRRR